MANPSSSSSKPVAAAEAPSLLIVISAPSGAGKTTLCQRLLADFPDIQLSISCTTRAPRGKEQNGRDYFFLTVEEFEASISRGDFTEWARVHGNYYGTSKKFVEDTLARGQSVLLDIDVQGAESFRRLFPEQSLLIFVAPPSLEVLEQRLRDRGTDSEASIQGRMKNAAEEMARQDLFDHVLVNDDLNDTYRKLSSLVSAALSPTRSHVQV
jgi:guanylate kinase